MRRWAQTYRMPPSPPLAPCRPGRGTQARPGLRSNPCEPPQPSSQPIQQGADPGCLGSAPACPLPPRGGVPPHLVCGGVVCEYGPVLHDHVKQVQAVHVGQALEELVRVAVVQLPHQPRHPRLAALQKGAAQLRLCAARGAGRRAKQAGWRMGRRWRGGEGSTRVQPLLLKRPARWLLSAPSSPAPTHRGRRPGGAGIR